MANNNPPPTFQFALREDIKDQLQFLPTKAEPLATGWDVRVALTAPDQQLIVRLTDYVKIPLGFRTFCPPGWWFELKPRSSTFGKKSLHALYGTIDESYEGELIFAAQYLPSAPGWTTQVDDLILNHGDAIGQIVPVERQDMIVTSISNADFDALVAARAATRGTGGFGSTGI
jgi:dUTPase